MTHTAAFWFIGGAGAGVAGLSATILCCWIVVRCARLVERDKRRRKRQDLYSMSAVGSPPTATQPRRSSHFTAKAITTWSWAEKRASIGSLRRASASSGSAAVVDDLALLSAEHAASIDLGLPPLPPRTALGSLQYSLRYYADSARLEIAIISARGLSVKPCNPWARLRAWVSLAELRGSEPDDVSVHEAGASDSSNSTGICDQPQTASIVFGRSSAQSFQLDQLELKADYSTKVVEKDNNPNFNETFTIEGILPVHFGGTHVRLAVYNSLEGGNPFIGQVFLQPAKILAEGTCPLVTRWASLERKPHFQVAQLTKTTGDHFCPLGEVELLLTYDLFSEELQINVLKARNLPMKEDKMVAVLYDSYVKIICLCGNETIGSARSHTICKDISPVFGTYIAFSLARDQLANSIVEIRVKEDRYCYGSATIGIVAVAGRDIAMVTSDCGPPQYARLLASEQKWLPLRAVDD